MKKKKGYEYPTITLTKLEMEDIVMTSSIDPMGGDNILFSDYSDDRWH